MTKCQVDFLTRVDAAGLTSSAGVAPAPRWRCGPAAEVAPPSPPAPRRASWRCSLTRPASSANRTRIFIHTSLTDMEVESLHRPVDARIASDSHRISRFGTRETIHESLDPLGDLAASWLSLAHARAEHKNRAMGKTGILTCTGLWVQWTCDASRVVKTQRTHGI